jgi:hypothetical protein
MFQTQSPKTSAYSILKAFSLIFSVGLYILSPTAGLAAPPEIPVTQSIELTFRLNSKLKRLELVDQRIVDRSARKHRDPRLLPGELIVQCENELHENIGRFSISDPSIIRSEWLDENAPSESPGLLQGRRFRSEESIFKVVVPFDDHLAYLRLLQSKPLAPVNFSEVYSHRDLQDSRRVVDDDQLETVGVTSVDRAKIKVFAELRRSKHSKPGMFDSEGRSHD